VAAKPVEFTPPIALTPPAPVAPPAPAPVPTPAIVTAPRVAVPAAPREPENLRATESLNSGTRELEFPRTREPENSRTGEPANPRTPDPATPVRDITELIKDLEPIKAEMEEAIEPERREKRPWLSGWRRIAAIGLVAIALGEAAIIAVRAYRQPPPAAGLGTLSVQTNPPGVAVFVDGVAHGNTPARLSLPAGSHIVELRGRGVPRVIPVTVTAGIESSQYLELPVTPSTGSLLVQSDPGGARVFVDGVERGVAPVSVDDLAPGEHEVVLQPESGAPVKQRVTIQAGVTATVLAPVPTAAPGPVSGWLSVKAPVAIEIHENGRLLGTTETDRIMLAAGRHEIRFVNETLGYNETRTIQVPPGRVAPVTIELPMGVINLNATPWAEVFIDGRKVGETPLGNFPIAIGPHEIVFRHPQLGEKRQAVSVTLKAPVRLSVDMK
jgi:hypothetical protein